MSLDVMKRRAPERRKRTRCALVRPALPDEVLRASEERYRDLFEHTRDIVFTTDLQMRFTSLNLAGEVATGYTREEAAALTIEDVVAAGHVRQIHQRMRDPLADEAQFDAEIIAKDGRRIPVEISARVIFRAGRPVEMQGIARDLGEGRRLEEQLRQAQRLEAVGRLASGIAHDFNNMVTVIHGCGIELAASLEPSDPRKSLALELCHAGEAAAGLARHLLTLGRRQVLRPRVMDLIQFVRGVEEKLRRLVGADIDLVTVAAHEVHAIRADPGQIEQVIMNLAVNAGDAMPGGGRLTVEIANAELDAQYAGSHPDARPGAYVRLSVADTGVGMDQATLSRLFEPFFTTKETHKGTGLGLATVHGIVKHFGGHVAVDSEVGGGSVFHVYLPRTGD